MTNEEKVLTMSKEEQAELVHAFAMELLMPKVLFRTKYKKFMEEYKNNKRKVYEELAEYFGVPVYAAEERVMSICGGIK